MLFQIKHEGPLAPNYFLQSFNGTPHPLVRLELAELAEELAAVVPFVSWSECFRMIVRLSVLVSATTATRCYLYMYAADGILGSASVRLVYSRLGRQVCAVQNTSNCTECGIIAVCSVHTGYVFFGTLVFYDILLFATR